MLPPHLEYFFRRRGPQRRQGVDIDWGDESVMLSLGDLAAGEQEQGPNEHDMQSSPLPGANLDGSTDTTLGTPSSFMMDTTEMTDTTTHRSTPVPITPTINSVSNFAAGFGEAAFSPDSQNNPTGPSPPSLPSFPHSHIDSVSQPQPPLSEPQAPLPPLPEAVYQ